MPSIIVPKRLPVVHTANEGRPCSTSLRALDTCGRTVPLNLHDPLFPQVQAAANPLRPFDDTRHMGRPEAYCLERTFKGLRDDYI
jgi:hypothetical protein